MALKTANEDLYARILSANGRVAAGIRLKQPDLELEARQDLAVAQIENAILLWADHLTSALRADLAKLLMSVDGAPAQEARARAKEQAERAKIDAERAKIDAERAALKKREEELALASALPDAPHHEYDLDDEFEEDEEGYDYDEDAEDL